MFKLDSVLNKANIPTSCETGAVIHIGNVIRATDDWCQTATDMIKRLIDRDEVFSDRFLGLSTVQYLVSQMFKDGENFDCDAGLEIARQRATAYRNTEEYQCHFRYKTHANGVEQFQVIGGVEVEIREDGKIKKRGKAEIAYSLFVSCVIEGRMSTKQCVDEIVKHGQMSEKGATTYFYNAKAKYVKEVGPLPEWADQRNVKKKEKAAKAEQEKQQQVEQKQPESVEPEAQVVAETEQPQELVA